MYITKTVLQYLQSLKACAFPHLSVCLFCRAKLKEIKAGADGFLVFDPDLVQPLIQVSNLHFALADKPKYVLTS